MGYVTYRAVMAFIFALAVTLMIGGKIIKYLELKNIGDVPRELGVDGLKRKKGVPTMGGVIIFSAIVIPVLLFCKLSNIYVLKTEDIHPPKTGISVHFSCSLP